MNRAERAQMLARTLRFAAGELERDPFQLSGLAGGSWIEELETKVGDWIGTSHVLTASSATGALVTALRALDIGPGDEVVVPSYGWIGCVAAILMVGADPVWADIEETTFQVSPGSVLQAIGPRTAAVLAPHLCGYPCEIAEVAAIARARGLALIEDGSQAFGARVAGSPVGRWGDFAVFSFGPGKLIDAGEGGLLVARSAELRERALLVAQHPLRQAIEVRHPSLRSAIGGALTLNFRIHPLAALLARVQIQDLDARMDHLRHSHATLRKRLEELNGIGAAALPIHHDPNGALIPLRFDPASRAEFGHEVFREAQQLGITIVEGPVGVPCHLRPGLEARQPTLLPVTEQRCSGEEFFVRVEAESLRAGAQAEERAETQI